MPKEKLPFEGLIPYLPEGSYDHVMPYILKHKVHLTLTKERKTILGNYRAPFQGKGHRITVNANLNKYSFLVTLLHELAHLFTWDKYGHKVVPHGNEWKGEFSAILKDFLIEHFFPEVIEKALLKSMHNPAASSCGDENLMRALKLFDLGENVLVFVEQLKKGQHFKMADGREFSTGEKLRKRYKCQEIKTKKWYLFSGLYEVIPILE